MAEPETGLSDLVLLSSIDEDAVVAELQKRHEKDEIYTFIGEVVLSVNPFRAIPGVTGPDIVKNYQVSRGKETRRMQCHRHLRTAMPRYAQSQRAEAPRERRREAPRSRQCRFFSDDACL